MRYVVAGYVFVLFVLALYSVQLIWRRRCLARAVDRAAGSNPVTSNPVTSNPVTSNPVTSNPVTSNPVTSNPVTSNPVGEVVP
jgi:cell division septation protein DedD